MEDLLKAAQTALDMEKKGYDTYMAAAKRTVNKLGRSTLEAIASKELDHIKAIETFYAKMSGKSQRIDEAVDAINPKDKKDYIRPIMDKLRVELNDKVKPDSDLEKAYDVAMGLEKHSYNLYKKLAGETNDKQVKEFFRTLMGEENTHYQLLQETLEYLNHPGDWFKIQERWIVEG